MSKKNKDKKNRWRKKTIAFRVSNEENEMIDEMVSMSGMKKTGLPHIQHAAKGYKGDS